MLKPTQKVNYWNQHHNSLSDEYKLKAIANIIKILEWSLSTVYRKKANPDNIRYFEKILVAKAYGVEVDKFFPDVEPIQK